VINICVFPVAGYGTRFLPVTKSVPKEMLPINTKPLIHYAVDEANKAGIDNMLFIMSDEKEAIKDYFTSSPKLNHILEKKNNNSIDELNSLIVRCNFVYAYQDEMLGLGHAISISEKHINDDRFCVVLPDDLCTCDGNSVLSQLREVSKSYPGHCIVAVEEIEIKNSSKYGIIKISNRESLENVYKVDALVEKPDPISAPSNLAVIGRYILTQEIFNHLRQIKKDLHGEIQITDALNLLAKKGKVLALRFSGKRFDCGSNKGFLEANNYFSK